MVDSVEVLGVVAVATSCLISVITSIISLNCLSDKKYDCAQRSGIVAAVFSFMLSCAIVVTAVHARHRS